MAKAFVPAYFDATATRELADRLAAIHPRHLDDADLRIAQATIARLIGALKRSLHKQPQPRDATYIDRMKRPLDVLRHGLAAQMGAMDPEFFREWAARSRASQRAA